MVDEDVIQGLTENFHFDEEGVDLDGNLHVDGKISGGEIVEDMDGYSFVKLTGIENITIDYIYAGAVKNGNKLTLTLFVRLTRTGDVPNNYLPNIGRFIIPSSIGAKIYPTSYTGEGSLELIGFGKETASRAYNDFVDLPCMWRKLTDTDIRLNYYYIQELALNATYLVRSELTLLLSDNLAA